MSRKCKHAGAWSQLLRKDNTMSADILASHLPRCFAQGEIQLLVFGSILFDFASEVASGLSDAEDEMCQRFPICS
eukprot:2518996-Karenia_brevis.AAC.1